MARFRYRALAPTGEVTEAVMDAPDRDAVIRRLREIGHLPVRIAPAGEGLAPATDAVRIDDAPGPPPDTRVSRSAVTVLIRSLQTLAAAALPVDEAFAVIAETAGPLASVARDLRQRVRGGESLSDAMAAHGHAFGPFERAMVRAGEAGARSPAPSTSSPGTGSAPTSSALCCVRRSPTRWCWFSPPSSRWWSS